MTGDAGGCQGRFCEALHHQRGAQHGDPVSWLGMGGQHSGIGIRRPGHDDQIVSQAQGFGLVWCDRSQDAAAATDVGQCLLPGLCGKAGWPAVGDEIPAQSEIVAFFPPAPVVQQPSADPVRLMTQQDLVAVSGYEPKCSRQAAAAALRKVSRAH